MQHSGQQFADSVALSAIEALTECNNYKIRVQQDGEEGTSRQIFNPIS